MIEFTTLLVGLEEEADRHGHHIVMYGLGPDGNSATIRCDHCKVVMTVAQTPHGGWAVRLPNGEDAYWSTIRTACGGGQE